MTYFSYNTLRLGVGLRKGIVKEINTEVNKLTLDSWIVQVDYEIFKNCLLSYSYEITTNKLNQTNTYGTHEFGIIYTFEGSVLCPSRFKNDIDCIKPIPELQNHAMSGL